MFLNIYFKSTLTSISSQNHPFQYWLLLNSKEMQMKAPALATVNESHIFAALQAKHKKYLWALPNEILNNSCI